MQPFAVVVFIFCSSVVLYVLVGYPLLLAVLARRERPLRRAWHPLSVTVLLPVYNGENWIRSKLETIFALDYPHHLLEIIVISDGSTDGTEAIVQEFVARGVRLLRVVHGGKALALNAGIAEAHGEILFFTDVRQHLQPDSLRRLVECFDDPAVGVVSGELIIREGSSHEEANIGLYWRHEKWIRERLSRIDSVLGATGAIYAMRRALAVPLPPGSLLDDMYLPLAAFFRGYRVVLDRSARAFDFPTALHSEFGRKVRTLAGNYEILCAFPALLGPRNRMWLHYVSHKFGRLLIPYALLGALLASFWIPYPWNRAAIAAQCAVLALAAVDLLLPQRSAIKRITSPVRTFIVMMAASFCAVSFFFTRGRNLWKPTRVRHS